MFTVTITQTTIKELPCGKEWERISSEADSKYGYTPEIVKKKEIELKIYEQIMDFIDIKKVIDAVNDGPKPPLVVDESLVGEIHK